MRTLGAALFAALCLVILARPAAAGPPPPPLPTEERPLAPIITELKTKGGPANQPPLAVARWYAEVLGVKTVTVPVTAGPSLVGSPPRVAADAIARCELPRGEQKAAAAKLLAEFGEALPLKLRATALASGGKTKEAVKLLLQMVAQTAPEAPCAPEHPATQQTRLETLDKTEACLKAFDPKADLSAVTRARERVKHCMATVPSVAG